MIALHGLRILGDLAFYYAFAGFFAAGFGGHPTIWVLLWPAVCFAAATCFRGNPSLRTVLALASAAALPFLPARADQLVYLPAVCYVTLLAVREEFGLSAVQQGERFRWLLRIWPLFGAAMLLWNADAVLTTALPMAITAALALVWFTRTTRQDPEVYSAPSYLLISGGLLAALSGAAFLLSRSAVMNGVKALAAAVYFKLLVPVLQLVLNNVVAYGIVVVFQKLWYAIAWVLALFANRQVAMGDLYGIQSGRCPGRHRRGERPADGRPTGAGRSGGALCGGAADLAVRHILRRGRAAEPTDAAPMTKRRTSLRTRRRWPGLFLSPNARVRREYRAYLDYCEAHGLTILRGDTSLDIMGRASGMDYAAEAELREIYLRARYAETATAEDAARAAELVKKICE